MKIGYLVCCTSLVLAGAAGDGSTISDILTAENTQKVFVNKENSTCQLKTDSMKWRNHTVTKLVLSGPASVEVRQVKTQGKYTTGLLRLHEVAAEGTVEYAFWGQKQTNIVTATVGDLDIEVKILADSPKATLKIRVISVEDVRVSEVPLILSEALHQAEDSLHESGPMIQKSLEAIVNAALGTRDSSHCL